MAGQPKIVATPEEFERLTQEYYDKCANSKPPGIPTLVMWAHYLGFASVQSIYDYERLPEYSYVVKRGRLPLEAFHEEGLSKQSCVGHIFWLKNKSDYADRQDHQLSGPNNGPIQTDSKIEIILRKAE